MDYINNIPDEVLGKIFQVTCPVIYCNVEEPRHGAYIGHLGRVCRAWRNIVLTHSYLWTELDLRLVASFFALSDNPSFRPGLLKLVIQRSKTSPLTFRFSSSDMENTFKYERSFETLYSAANRWYDVELDGILLLKMVERNPGRWNIARKDMPLLERLSLKRSDHCDSVLGTFMGLTWGSLPKLRDLSLEHYGNLSSIGGSLTNRGFPWAQITRLSLIEGSRNAWMELGAIDDFFRQLPDLVDLIIDPLYPSLRRKKTPIVFKHLESFSFCIEYMTPGDSGLWPSALSFIKAPNLVSLSARIRSRANSTQILKECLGPFFESSCGALKRLSLMDCDNDLARFLLKYTPSVESLFLDYVHCTLSLKTLTWNPDVDDTNLLPNLSTLNLLLPPWVLDLEELSVLLASRTSTHTARQNLPPIKLKSLNFFYCYKSPSELQLEWMDDFKPLLETYNLKGDTWPLPDNPNAYGTWFPNL
ncbi:hypothetical protein DFP72DRAFT_919159 [Ephemerocybe angulata]|uniref:F-box domain-containing protein n=1 Tax=Ephemerocybe angulata TaxID=980116 RepID=A0A8H6HJX5_9AGAR|nr:hypothetical protein DFP72DRAFT_919159 [Tulosesus angulatus]